MKPFLLLALLTLAALSPAPIRDPRRGLKPVPEQSEAQVQTQMRFNGVYGTVGRVPRKTEERVVVREDAERKNDGALAAASAEISRRDDGAIVRASEKVAETKEGPRVPFWLVIALVAGGAFGIVRGLRAWVDRAVPVPRR